MNNKIREFFKKRVWLNYTLSLFNIHLEKGTTPLALFYDKFPRPYLADDVIFVDKYNQIIESTQRSIIELCINSLTDKLVKIDEDLNSIKQNLSNYFAQDNLNSRMESIEKKEEDFLKPRMNKSNEKFYRIFAKKFEVKNREQNENIQRNSIRNSNLNLSQSSSYSLRNVRENSNYRQNFNNRQNTSNSSNWSNRSNYNYRSKSNRRNSLRSGGRLYRSSSNLSMNRRSNQYEYQNFRQRTNHRKNF